MANYTCIPSAHGRRHLEFEITYPMERAAARDETYRLDVWFFIPHPLQHWCENNPSARFFRDLVAYTRFKPFSIPLSILADIADKRNPLSRIHNLAASDTLDEEKTIKNMIYELRMLVNVFQSQFRGQCAVIDRMVASENYPLEDVEVVAARLLNEAEQILTTFGKLEPLILAPHVPETLRYNYRWADESLSIRMEKNCHRLYRTLHTANVLPQVAESCRVKIAAQIAHRQGHHYESIVQKDNEHTNELFSYREHQLKKWAESAMYMTVANSRIPEHIMHFSFGVAAAAAMGFAVAVALVAEAYFHVRSYPWIILAVIAYVFKDRIKDVLRGVSQRWMSRLTADRMQRLINPYSGRRVGLTRERVRVLNIRQIPIEVRRLRHNRPNAYQYLTPHEDVLHYQKEISFHSAPLQASENRLAAICEILRLDMRHWFYKMDKSDDNLVYVENDKIRTINARRVYHFNVIMRLVRRRDGNEPPTLYRYRVVANLAGIIRIEDVTG